MIGPGGDLDLMGKKKTILENLGTKLFIIMALETRDGNMTLAAVNAVLGGEWVAHQNPQGLYNGSLAPDGFELFQGQVDTDGDMVCTTDSIPVVKARVVGNSIKFTLLGGKAIELRELTA